MGQIYFGVDSPEACYRRGGADGFPAAYAGSHFMAVNENISPEIVIGQEVPLVGGTQYTLSFAVGGNGAQADVGRLIVKLGDDFEQTIAARPVSQGWLTYSFDYTPGVDGNATLSFTGTDGRLGLVALDEVSLAPVPEPGTWALLAAGLAGVSVIARRRAHRPSAA